MDIRRLSEVYAVSPQIAPDDVAAIAAEGFTTIICNRPDHEVMPEVRSDAVRRAAEAAGLGFVDLPIHPHDLGPRMIGLQAEAMRAAAGPVLAYCASGTRSTVIWMFAAAGEMPAEELIGAAARAGYALDNLRPILEALASR